MTTFESQLKPCVCGYMGKLKGSHVFGYLTIECPTCNRKLTGHTRSGSSEYILEQDLLERWNSGESDDPNDD